jgi:hypothetical protein
MKELIPHAICKRCAECCKNYPYVRLSLHEIRELKMTSAIQIGEWLQNNFE